MHKVDSIHFHGDGVDMVEVLPPGHVKYDDFKTTPYYSEDVVLMQYTGLRDKNGKEIYEGDIVEYDDLDCGLSHDEGKAAVVYNDELACFGWTQDDGCRGCLNPFELFSGCQDHNSSEHLEVIGNIYENPELME